LCSCRQCTSFRIRKWISRKVYYPDSTVYDSSIAYEGIEAEWGEWEVEGDTIPTLAFIEDGKLKWEVPDSAEVFIGMWELSMDLTENTDIKFKYQFPAGTLGE